MKWFTRPKARHARPKGAKAEDLYTTLEELFRPARERTTPPPARWPKDEETE